MSVDDVVRRTLRSEAERYDPADDGWGPITGRVAASRRRRRRVQGGAFGGVAVATVALLVAMSVTSGGETDVDATDASGLTADDGTTTTTSAAASTVPPTTAAAAPRVEGAFPGIWPYTDPAAVAEGGDTRFSNPAVTAEAFAREYVGMLDPAVGDVEATAAGDARVVLTPKGEDGEPLPEGGASTVVTLRSFDTADDETVWTVTGAASPNVSVQAPLAGAEVASPLAVRGRATGYEGTVVAEVRADGMLAGEALGQEVGIAGSMGELGPLQVDVAFVAPDGGTGALVVTTDTGRDGVGVFEATVVRLRFAEVAEQSPVPGSGERCGQEPQGAAVGEESMIVTLYLICDAAVESNVDVGSDGAFVAVTRSVPRSEGVLRATLDALVEGTEPHEEDVASSFFSSDTTDLLDQVTIKGGKAVVDFDEQLTSVANGASTSTGSVLFRGQLNRTVLQFATVDGVEYRLGGSCDAFWEWQQLGPCQLVTRDDL